jgi:hypothetical protein
MGDGLHYEPSKDSPDVPGDDESGELKQAAAEAFPDEEWSPERLGALKTLMKLCMDDYGGGESEPDEDDKKSVLSLIFGAPKKK